MAEHILMVMYQTQKTNICEEVFTNLPYVGINSKILLSMHEIWHIIQSISQAQEQFMPMKGGYIIPVPPTYNLEEHLCQTTILELELVSCFGELGLTIVALPSFISNNAKELCFTQLSLPLYRVLALPGYSMLSQSPGNFPPTKLV